MVDLADRSLARVAERPLLCMSLHDIHAAVARESAGDDLAALHARLVSAYEAAADDWHALPDDGHVHRHLVHHLAEAGRPSDAAPLLLCARWLSAALAATHDLSALLETVAATAMRALDEHAAARLAECAAALLLSAHVLADDPGQLLFQLVGRLPPGSALAASAAAALRDAGGTRLHGGARVALRPPPELFAVVGGPLRRAITTHTDWVRCVAVAPAAPGWLATGSTDQLVHVYVAPPPLLRLVLLLVRRPRAAACCCYCYSATPLLLLTKSLITSPLSGTTCAPPTAASSPHAAATAAPCAAWRGSAAPAGSRA